MKVKDMIEWLKTQNQESEVFALNLGNDSGIKYHCWNSFDPEKDCQTDENSKILFIGYIDPHFFEYD